MTILSARKCYINCAKPLPWSLNRRRNRALAYDHLEHYLSGKQSLTVNFTFIVIKSTMKYVLPYRQLRFYACHWGPRQRSFISLFSLNASELARQCSVCSGKHWFHKATLTLTYQWFSNSLYTGRKTDRLAKYTFHPLGSLYTSTRNVRFWAT